MHYRVARMQQPPVARPDRDAAMPFRMPQQPHQANPRQHLRFGTVLGVQGLWVGPWLADVDGLSAPEVAADLAWMAAAVTVAAPVWGALTAWMRARPAG